MDTIARRNQAYEALKDLPGVSVHKPAGTFYIFPDLSLITNNSFQFALGLLKEEQVVMIPAEMFGHEMAHYYLSLLQRYRSRLQKEVK